MPAMAQHIQLDTASGIVMLAILYIVVGFWGARYGDDDGRERTKEFGILIAVGMKKWRLIWVTTLETMFVASIGALTGVIGSLPRLYLYQHPIRIAGDAAKAMDKLGFRSADYF